MGGYSSIRYDFIMTTVDDYLNFPIPTKGIRDLYKPEISENREGWTKTHVKVMRKDISTSGEEKWTQVAEYERNYAMLKTFEPFQHLQDGLWKHYALISTRYTRLEVLDLQSGEIIAVEPFPKADAHYAHNSNGKVEEGDDLPGMGFCPMEFYVPDWWDEYDETYIPKKDEVTGEMKHPFKSDSYALEILDEFKEYSGRWGLYGGCIWGDDSSTKMRYVDLSRISEGVVTTDERFGYVQIPDNLTLRESVQFNADEGYITLLTPIMFNIENGTALGKSMFTDYINWSEN